jgi:hypothetical protein
VQFFVAGPLEYSSLESMFNADLESMFNADPDSAFPNSEFLRPVENSQEILRDTAGRADLGAATKPPLRYSAQQLPRQSYARAPRTDGAGGSGAV